jgi:hypothetical protein
MNPADQNQQRRSNHHYRRRPSQTDRSIAAQFFTFGRSAFGSGETRPPRAIRQLAFDCLTTVRRRPKHWPQTIWSAGQGQGQSFIGVAFDAFVGWFDPDSTARQRLSEKHLDFGVDAPQVGCGAPLHRVKYRFLRPERERNAFRAWGPSSSAMTGHE